MHFELKNAEQLWLFRIFISSVTANQTSGQKK